MMRDDDNDDNNDKGDETSCRLEFQFRGQTIPVTKSPAVTMEQAHLTLHSNPFRSWVHKMETSTSISSSSEDDPLLPQQRQIQMQIRSVELQSVDLFGTRGVGFCKIKADCTLINTVTNDTTNNNDHVTSSTTNLPGICFLRGDAVAILVALFCHEDNTVHSLLVEQPR
jgi:hypothetical protein